MKNDLAETELKAAREKIEKLERALKKAQDIRSEGMVQQTHQTPVNHPTEEERKLKMLLEILPVGVSILDAEGKIVFENSMLSRILDIDANGLRQGIYKKRTYLAADGTPMPADGFASVQAAQKGEPVYNVETGIVKENGETTWASVSAVPTDFPDWKTVLVTTDITERKLLESSLRESEQKYTVLFEKSTVPVVLLKLPEVVIADANEAAEKLTGYRREEMIGRTAAELGLISQKQRAEEITRFEKEHALAENERRIMTRSGEERIVISNTNPLEIGGKPYAITSMQDITERRQVEESLRESEESYRSLFEHMTDGYAYCQMLYENGEPQDWIYLSTNPSFEQQTGLKDVNGKRVSEVIPGIRQADPKLFEIYSRVAVSGQSEKFEMFVDALQMWFSISVYSPKREFFVAVFDVITERKQAEEALERTRSTLTEAQKIAHLGSFEYVAATQTTVWSEEEYRIYGLDPSGPSPEYEVMLQKCIHPDDAALLHETFTRAMQTRSAYELEHRVVRPDGSVRWVYDHARPYFGEQGELIRYVGITLDITERKQIEDKLRESEARYRLIADHAADVIWVLDPLAGKFTYVSPSVEKLRGYTPQEVMTQPVDAALTPESLKAVSESLAENLPLFIAKGSGTETFINEVDQPCKDGSIVNTEVTTTYLFNEQGQVEIVGVSRDITARKRDEQELKRWADIFQNVSFGFTVGQPDNRLLGIMNPAFARMHGYAMDELIGTPIANVFAPEDRAALPEHIRLIHETGHHAWEATHLRKDGTLFPVNVDAVAVKDEAGKILYRIVSVQDISDRKRAEELRARLTERLNLATQGAQIGIWDWDIQKNAIVWDDQMYALYGLKASQFGGAYEAWLHGVHPEDREASNEISAAAVRGERKYDTEFRVLWPDGSVHWLKADGEVFRDETGKPLRMIGINYDITARKQLEESLRERERSYRELVQNANSAILRWKSDGTIIFFNEFAQKFFGYPPEEIIGKPVNILVPQTESTGGDLSGLVKNIVAHPEQFINVVNENICKDGHRVWMVWTNKPVYDKDGKLSEILAVGADITERKLMEEDLRRSNAELEQFAYVASHDLQEPLRAVTGMVQLLQKKYRGKLDEQADEYIRHMVEAANRMQALINDLLAFSRVDRRGREMEPVPVQTALDTALANLQTAINESGAIITHASLPTVVADPAQLAQLFQNLIGNAIKFRGEETPRVEVGVTRLAEAYRFSVRDNGIGIESQYFERIFLVFQRLHARHEYVGTGIGLAICKKIVERHGGQIWVESEPGQGSTFFFTIPYRSN